MKQSQPSYYAFFDVDGTLLNLKTTHSFLRYFLVKKSRIKGIGVLKFYNYILKIKLYELLKIQRVRLNKLYCEQFRGEKEEFLRFSALEWFYSLRDDGELFLDKVIAELKQHRKKGAKIVFVSGSLKECVMPIAKKLLADEVLAINLESTNGVLTGGLVGHQTIGQGKADAINELMAREQFNKLEQCFAYGDHISDIPMLSMVGFPIAVCGDPSLRKNALHNGWKIIEINS